MYQRFFENQYFCLTLHITIFETKRLRKMISLLSWIGEWLSRKERDWNSRRDSYKGFKLLNLIRRKMWSTGPRDPFLKKLSNRTQVLNPGSCHWFSLGFEARTYWCVLKESVTIETLSLNSLRTTIENYRFYMLT